MKHLSSLVAVTVENQTDAPITVSSISMTADGVDIIGTYYIDFTQDPAVFTPSGDTYVSSTAVLVVNDGEEIAPKESAKFYFAVKPFVVNEGDMLTLMVSGSNGPEEILNEVKIKSLSKNAAITTVIEIPQHICYNDCNEPGVFLLTPGFSCKTVRKKYMLHKTENKVK